MIKPPSTRHRYIELKQEIRYKCLQRRPKAGTYYFLNVPKISTWQWHPFSLCALHDEGGNNSVYLSFLIAGLGDWTKALHKHVSKNVRHVPADILALRDGTGASEIDKKLLRTRSTQHLANLMATVPGGSSSAADGSAASPAAHDERKDSATQTGPLVLDLML